jgi:hypothetical protein
MRKAILSLALLALLALPTLLTGCKDEIPPEILGTWKSVEELPNGDAWSLTYIIGPDRYWVSGNPPTVEGGLVEVDDTICRRYHLLFTERVANGELAPDINVWVELSHDGSEMRWQEHLYKRLSDRQQPGDDYQYDPS